MLLGGYLLTLALALLALVLADLPLWARLLAGLFAVLHALRLLPRYVLLSSAQAFTGVRHDAQGWQLHCAAHGWRAVQLRPDSLALPLVIVLRFRLVGERRLRAVCIVRDALEHDVHRRLRLQLKFSRHRWAAPE
ncbi:MAG: toxin CptA [Pseudomonas sp.]